MLVFIWSETTVSVTVVVMMAGDIVMYIVSVAVAGIVTVAQTERVGLLPSTLITE